jgi:phage N-6-adenine-methyltransferase
LTPRVTGRPRKYCSDVCRKRAQRLAQKARNRAKKDEWTTPQDLYDELDAEFGFTVDVAATAENAKCARYYDKKSNGLAQSWQREVAFCNPPYSRSAPWIEKAYNDTRGGE